MTWRLAIERGIVAKLQVIELAELVERNDVGDFSGFGIDPSVASVRRDSVRRSNERCPANLKYPSSRDQNVI